MRTGRRPWALIPCPILPQSLINLVDSVDVKHHKRRRRLNIRGRELCEEGCGPGYPPTPPPVPNKPYGFCGRNSAPNKKTVQEIRDQELCEWGGWGGWGGGGGLGSHFISHSSPVSVDVKHHEQTNKHTSTTTTTTTTENRTRRSELRQELCEEGGGPGSHTLFHFAPTPSPQ